MFFFQVTWLLEKRTAKKMYFYHATNIVLVWSYTSLDTYQLAKISLTSNRHLIVGQINKGMNQCWKSALILEIFRNTLLLRLAYYLYTHYKPTIWCVCVPRFPRCRRGVHYQCLFRLSPPVRYCIALWPGTLSCCKAGYDHQW